MTPSTLQKIIDEFHATSPQRWALGLAAIVTPIVAVLAAGAANGKPWPVGLVLVMMLGALSAVRPDNNTALVVVGMIVWHWLATIGDVSTPWLPVAAVCLLIYHSVIALSASIPLGGVLPRATINRWAQNTAIVATATIAMWALAAALDTRDARGNGFFTAVALAIVAGAAVFIRSRSLQPRR